MKIFFTFFILLIAIKGIACKCAISDELNSKNDMKRYDFIALVKIVKLPPTNAVYNIRANGHIRIQVIDLFKGKPIKWAYDDGFGGDCMLNLNEGEQWIFFARYYKGRLSVNRCTHSVRYADQTGLREWTATAYWTGDGVARLAKLRELYGRPVISNANNKVFYANGKLEIEQIIKQNKLDGVRKIYYPNGHLFLKEQFKNGQRVGVSEKISRTGQLLEQVVYRNGLISVSATYTDTTETVAMLKQQATLKVSSILGGDYPRTGKQVAELLDSLKKTQYWKHPLARMVIYNIAGHSQTEKGYRFDGKIDAEKYLDWRKKTTNEKWYINGRITLEQTTDELKNQHVFITHDINGHIEKTIQNCDNCEQEFSGKNVAAKPANAYIQ